VGPLQARPDKKRDKKDDKRFPHKKRVLIL